jgi:GDP-L-fucose synthase
VNLSSKIYIAGHEGMVGSAIHRCMTGKGYKNFVLRKLEELDLTRQEETEIFFKKEQPEIVIDAAAKVGGILANNTYRAQFVYENLMIQNNLIHTSYKYGAGKLLFLGSSCIYPKNAPQPMKEDYLLTGELEPTNEPYAIAKIAGIKMCESYFRQYGSNFISVMPTNLYGPNDNYNLETSHVLPAIIRKMHLGRCLASNGWKALRDDLDKRPVEGISGKNTEEEIRDKLKKFGITHDPETGEVTITLWGTGQVFREFMHVDDMAAACVKVLEDVNAADLIKPDSSHPVSFLNIGTGEEYTIAEIAEMVKSVTGFTGKITWDNTKPDGTYRKLLDIQRLKETGWIQKIDLKSGLEQVYHRYCK